MSFLLRLAAFLTVLMIGLVVVWTALVRIAQPSLPYLLYSSHYSLYVRQPGCVSLLAGCAESGQFLLAGLSAQPAAEWSPDGAYIAVYMAEQWVIYPATCLLANHNCQPAPLDSAINDIRLAWGPDGSTVAYMIQFPGGPGTALRIRTRGCWDGSPAEKCLTSTIYLSETDMLRHPYWSADGRMMAFIGVVPNGLFTLDLACLDRPEGCVGQLQTVPTQTLPVFWPSLSADGNWILYSGDYGSLGSKQIFLAERQTGAVKLLAGDSSNFDSSWSPDGRYVAYTRFEARAGGLTTIYMVDLHYWLSARVMSQPGSDLRYPSWSTRP